MVGRWHCKDIFMIIFITVHEGRYNATMPDLNVAFLVRSVKFQPLSTTFEGGQELWSSGYGRRLMFQRLSVRISAQ